MANCQLCELGKNSFASIMPGGSIHPDVYIVFDKPNDDELRYQNLMAGSRGQYLANSLTSVGASNFRYFSVIRCHTENEPTPEETESCLRYLRADILKTNPKVVVCAGAYPTQALLGIDDKISNIRGMVRELDIDGKKFPLIPIYSPTYVKNKYGGEVVSEFMQDMATISKMATGQYVDIMDKNQMEYALTYRDFKEFYVKNLMGEKMLAYDIETNAENVYSDKFRIIGWSLAKESCGIYVCLSSLDYEMPEEDKKACIDLLIAILKSTEKIVVHNSLYERPATYYQFGYELSFEKLEDTLVMAKVLLGGKIGAGLKPNARRIGYPDWETDLDNYIWGFCDALKRMSLRKFQPIKDKLNEGKSFDELFSELNDDEKFEEIIGYYNRSRDAVLRYYNEEETSEIMKLYSRKFDYALKHGIPGIIPYNWIPQRMLCKYGATDSLATFDLYLNFYQRLTDESTDEVDLHKGYYYDLMEHYAGYELMTSGLHWDDNLATRDRANYDLMRLNALKFCLLSKHPAMVNRVKWGKYGEVAPRIVYDSYNDYFREHFNRWVEQKNENSYVMKYIADNGRERSKHIKHLFEDTELPETISRDIDERVIAEAKRDILQATNPETLKAYYNPSSPKSAVEVFSEIVMCDDIRVGHFINKVRDNLVDNEEEHPRKEFNDSEWELICEIASHLKLDIFDQEAREASYAKLKEKILSIDRFENSTLQEYLGELRNVGIWKADEETQIWVHDTLKSTCMNPDNWDTWTPEFKWNICFRIYKKASKIISAYIDGSVGRQSVWKVNAKRLREGDDVVYRETPLNWSNWVDGHPVIEKDKDTLTQTNFGVGTAETGRWRSGVHLLPMGSTIKRLYTSRYVGGTILQPDFSANELRCVASAAQEDNMLEAFRNGLDIHRSNASKIFRVPLEEVTPFQRRWAKTLSFITLYGGGVQSIAAQYFNGDVNRAKHQLDDFYSAFPKLKSWIDSKHQEVMRTHKVSTLTDRFLSIDFDPNDQKSVSKAMRDAQNWPIQSLHGSTQVVGLDGNTYLIEELALENKDLWVYAYDTEHSLMIPVKGIQAQCTGYTDTWYEITLDNGESIKVTPEHKMMLRDGTYARADELRVGQSLMPIDFGDSSAENYYERIVDGKLHEPSVYRKIHKYVYPNVNLDKVTIHHIDMNPRNNSPENLIALSNQNHLKLHRTTYEFFENNDNSIFEFIAEDLLRATAKMYGDNDVAEEKMNHIIEVYEGLTENQKEELAEKSMSSRNKRRKEDYAEWYENQKNAVQQEIVRRVEETGNVLGLSAEDYSRVVSESWVRTRDTRVEILKKAHNSRGAVKNHSDAAKLRESNPDYVFNRLKRLLGFLIENNLPWDTEEDWDRSIQSYPEKCNIRYSSYIFKNFATWEEFLNRAKKYQKTYNHKIVDIKVIHLDKPEKKYDLHIPKYHNFALACGVFTHNSSSSTMAAVVFCDILLYFKKNNFKTKGVCFIHDSLESDVYPYELIKVIEYQEDKLANGAMDYFGIQCKADVSMGYSMGHECEMKSLKVLDDNHTKAEIVLEGIYTDILDTINNWKLAYHKVEILEEDLEEEYVSIDEMFIIRKAFEPSPMSHRKIGKVKVYVQYYNDNGEIEPMSDKFEIINIWDNAPVFNYMKNLEGNLD